MQVLLVTGGQKEQILDSTEILEMKENSVWKMSAPLPSPRLGLRAATVGNSLHVFGKTKFFAPFFKSQKMLINVYLTLSIAGGDLTTKLNNPITDILRYEASNETWQETGHMQAGRILHAVAVMEDISHLCP